MVTFSTFANQLMPVTEAILLFGNFSFILKICLIIFLSVSAKNIRGSLNSDLSNLISSYKFY